MKTTKASIFISAAVAVLALCASSASAIADVTMNYSKFNFSGTITTNLPEVDKGDSWKTPVKTAKFGNKQLLDLFAGWDGADRTTDPWKSAKLVIGWDHDADVLVVDKTGTNVLFDAYQGTYPDAYFYVDFWDEYGAGSESGKDADPGFYAVTDTDTAYFELYDDDVYLNYTDIECYGGNKQIFKQTWDADDNGKTWSDSESAKFLYNGDQYFQDFGYEVTSTAKFSANGKGKGYNYIGWADY